MYNIPEDLLGNLITLGIVIFVVIIKSISNSKQKQKRRSKEAGPNYNNTFLGQTANNQTAYNQTDYNQTAYKQTTNDKKTPGILRSLENALEQGIIEIQTLQTQHSQSDSARPASNRSNTVQSDSVQTNYTRSNSSQSGSAKTSIQARKAQEDKKKQLKEHFGLPEGKIHNEIHNENHVHDEKDILCRANINNKIFDEAGNSILPDTETLIVCGYNGQEFLDSLQREFDKKFPL